MSGNVGYFIKVAGANLTDMKINHVVIVSVNLSKFIRGERISLHPMLNMHMLMRKNDRRVSVMISRGPLVENLEILRSLVLINLKEEV